MKLYHNMAGCFLFALCVLSTLQDIASGRTLEPLCPPPPAPCQYVGRAIDEYFYFVQGKKLEIVYSKNYFQVTCSEGVSLESESMPRFERLVHVQKITIKQCGQPSVPYARALAALNVTAQLKLKITKPRDALRAFHLAGLAVAELELVAESPLRLERGTLAPLATLLDLHLSQVSLTAVDLAELPPTLVRLSLSACNLTALPASALGRLVSLRHLIIRDQRMSAAPDLSEAPTLRYITLSAPSHGLPSSNQLENMTSFNAKSLEILGGCSALASLAVVSAAGAPPAAWLVGCTRLTELSLTDIKLGTLPPDLLNSAHGLKKLTELFELVRALEELSLADNLLSRAAAASAFALPSLRLLELDRNPLGDLCPADLDTLYRAATSEVRGMQSLQTLGLDGTGATRLCADWRRDLPALGLLRLKRNNITSLEAADLVWDRSVPTEVQLAGNPLRSVTLSPSDYADLLSRPAPAHVPRFVMDATLQCDCLVYWAVRLLRERTLPIQDAHCSDMRALRSLRPDELVCQLRNEECASQCSCEIHGVQLHMRCAGAGLERVPRPPPGAPPASVLLLPDNVISNLTEADLGPELRRLDLSGNRIEDLDSKTTGALFEDAREVVLARNPLACRCGAVLPAALLARTAQSPEFAELTCGDGRRLRDLRLGDLCPAPWPAALGVAAGLALLASIALAGCLGHRAARGRIKRFLFDRGLCTRWLLRETAERDDRPYVYDVFVSFSHHDEKFVTERLVPGLEGGPRPYRLCLHYRDWTPGEWIPTQIGRSVRESRRTLLVVSAHWARSAWARAEFRAAYERALSDARPRLVLLLLEEPDALRDLDPDLRNFLAANTYLRWDDPWFWRKLRHALPRGAAGAPPASAAPLESVVSTAPGA